MTPYSWNPEKLLARIQAYPPYVGAGILVTHIAEDASEIRVEMELTEKNVNLVGTHFGGSLYSMVDPHLMILLYQRLGPGYVVWDKEAHIDFKKPGSGTVRTTIRITADEVAAIRVSVADGDRHFPQWTIDVLDEEDDVVATVLKTLYVRKEHSS